MRLRKTGMSLDSYIKSIKRGPDPLTPDEERKAGPEKLAEHSMRLALRLASKYFSGNDEKDVDVLSVAMCALTRQAQTFDPEKGRFSTVATAAIRRSIGIHRKKETQPFIGYSQDDHEKYDNKLVPFDDTLTDGQEATQLDDLCESDTETRVRRSVLVLAPRERRAIIQRYLIGRNPSDLASHMGISRDRLDRLCRIAIQKIREDIDE